MIRIADLIAAGPDDSNDALHRFDPVKRAAGQAGFDRECKHGKDSAMRKARALFAMRRHEPVTSLYCICQAAVMRPRGGGQSIPVWRPAHTQKHKGRTRADSAPTYKFGGVDGTRPYATGRGIPCMRFPSIPAASPAGGLLHPTNENVCLRRHF